MLFLSSPWAWLEFVDAGLCLTILVYIVDVYWSDNVKGRVRGALSSTPVDVNALSGMLDLYQDFQMVASFKLVTFVARMAKYLKLISLFEFLQRAWAVASVDIFKVFLMYLGFGLVFALSG